MGRQILERDRAHELLKSSSALSLFVQKCRPKLGEISLRRGGKNLTTDTRLSDSGPPTGDDSSTPELKMEIVVMHQVNYLVDNEVMKMIDRCKELLSGKHPCGIDYNTLMLELAQTWLEKHDPAQRAERRKKRKNKTHVKTSDTGETPRLGHVELAEHLEYFSQPCLRDADPRVSHDEHQSLTRVPWGGGETDLPLLGELEGVPEQVEDHTLQQHAITPHRLRAGGNLDPQLRLRMRVALGQGCGDFADQISQREAVSADGHLAGI